MTLSTAPGLLDAVREEIAFAYENVPFFADHLDRAGIKPASVTTAEDLRKVPATRKADYRSHFPAGIVARGSDLDDPMVIKTQSSGTGGDRLITVAHSYLLAERLQASLSVNPALLARLEAPTTLRPVRYAAPNCSDVECANPRSQVSDRVLPDGSLVLPVAHDLLATPADLVEQAVREVQDWNPSGFDADATHLAFLVRAYRARGLTPPPECLALVLGYTRATGVARRQIREFFPKSAVIAEVLGMSELGWLTVECPQGRMHLNDLTFYMELLVGDRPAEPGELGELIATSVGDVLSPHIRYRTGDLYRLTGEQCPCGHEFPVVLHEGRRRDCLMRAGEVVFTPREVDAVVGEAPWADVYRFQQHDEDRYSFRFIPNDSYSPGDEHDVVAALRAPLGAGAQLTVEATDYLTSDRSGKCVACHSALAAALPAA